MKKWILAIILLALMAMPVAADGNLIANGDFSVVNAQGLPDGWRIGMWLSQGITEMILSDAAPYVSSYSAMIDSWDENDARFEQTVAVEPNTLYKISCYIRATGVGEGAGANISVADTFEYSNLVGDTDGQWRRAMLYGRTGDNQRELTVMLRLGGYGSLNVGTAWFDDVVMERIDEVPPGMPVANFEPPERGSEQAAIPTADGAGDYTALILAACILFTLLCIIVFMYVPEGGGKTALGLTIALIAGLILRCVIGVISPGYGVDIGCWQGWADAMAHMQPWGFYEGVSFCDYPPGYMYVMWIVGSLRALCGIAYDSPAMLLLIKAVPCACDALLAWLIYKVASAHMSARWAAIIALFYWFNPAVWVNSAAWGQIDSVLTILLILAISRIVKKDWIGGMVWYAVAAATKPQALMFAPIGLLAAFVSWMDARDRGKQLKILLVAFGWAVLAFVLIVLPFSLLKNPVWLYEKYASTLSSYPYATVNALNIYALFDRNWVDVTAKAWLLTYAQWGYIAMAVCFVYGAFLYLKSRKAENLFLVCATVLVGLFVFGAKMHERYVFPAIALLCMAYVYRRDMRILLIALFLSATEFINVALVLQAEHLQSTQWLINNTVSLINIAISVSLFYVAYDVMVNGRVRPFAARTFGGKFSLSPDTETRSLQPESAKMNLRRADYAWMCGLTAIYAAVALFNLGVTHAPETSWMSTAPGETVTFDLGETRDFHIAYYGGICDTTFTVELSDDGVNFIRSGLAEYDEWKCFRWIWYRPAEYSDDPEDRFTFLDYGYPMQSARYVRIIAERGGMVLTEVAFIDANGVPYPVESISSDGGREGRAQDPAALIDEQTAVSAYPSYFNGMYFDEIYHGRTGYEHLHGMIPRENTHPPMGKNLIAFGIWLFGMSPFGWRIMGTITGILMVPLMYLLIMQLFRRRFLAIIGTIMMTFDFMHFTQTRIATIDSYAVFFIMLMFLLMYRYALMNFYRDKLWKTLLVLFFCGLAMGMGIASKWIALYSSVGLAFILFYTLYLRLMEYIWARKQDGEAAENIRRKFVPYSAITLAACCVFFVVITGLIYYYSYYMFLAPSGGLSIKAVFSAQLDMFNYHSKLTADGHFFASPWWQWPLIMKPMWYFSGTEFMPEGIVSSISAMGNPAVWWAGCVALIWLLGSLITGVVRDRRAWLIVIGFLAQYLPWVLVPRSMFIYHYFAGVPFIILCVLFAFERMKRKWVPIAYAAAVIALFIVFYPLISGWPVARDFAKLLRWFPTWYLY